MIRLTLFALCLSLPALATERSEGGWTMRQADGAVQLEGGWSVRGEAAAGTTKRGERTSSSWALRSRSAGPKRSWSLRSETTAPKLLR